MRHWRQLILQIPLNAYGYEVRYEASLLDECSDKTMCFRMWEDEAQLNLGTPLIFRSNKGREFNFNLRHAGVTHIF